MVANIPVKVNLALTDEVIFPVTRYRNTKVAFAQYLLG